MKCENVYARRKAVTLKSTVLGMFERPNRLQGQICQTGLRTESFTSALGIELIARTEKTELTAICQEIFVRLAFGKNDSAAHDALNAVHYYMVPTQRSSPYEMKLSIEAFAARKRAEENAFLQWVITIWWRIPLYVPETWVERTEDTPYFVLTNKLPETKSTAIAYIAHIWAKEFDEVSKEAFAFLCANSDSHLFAKHARRIAEDVMKERQKTDRLAYGSFQLPVADINMVLSHMRTFAPKDKHSIALWGKYAVQEAVPENVRRLLAHAFINAGATIFDA